MPGFLSASVSGQVRIVLPRLWESLLHTSRLLGLRGRGWPQRPRKSWLLQVDANATSPTWERACEMWMEGPGRQAGAPESGRASPPGTGVGSPPGGSGSWPPHAGLPAYSRARPGESCRQHREGCSPFWGLRLCPRRACCDRTAFG